MTDKDMTAAELQLARKKLGLAKAKVDGPAQDP